MAAPTNVLLILTDQQRVDTIASRGSPFGAPTPAMDALCRHGVFFDNAYCTAPISAPSRASFLTGQFPSQTGVYGNLGNPCPPLNEAHITIGHRMQAMGWETVYHGKSHLGGDLKHYGFEIAYENSHDPSTLTEAARFYRNRDWMVHRRPFFHVVSFLNPHDVYFLDVEEEADPTSPPWPNAGDSLASKPWPQRLKQEPGWSPRRWEAYRRHYGRMVSEVDGHIGELVRQLIYSGFGCNTWIILASDHGDMAGEHGLPFKGPYMYEGVTRVPLVVVPPQERFVGKGNGDVDRPSFAGSTCSDLVSLIDLVPTVLDLAGAPADAKLPGRSLLPAVRDQKPVGHEAVFAEWHQSGKVVTPIRMVRSGRWKYTEYLKIGSELYDLEADPHELRNLAGQAEYAAIEREMRARLEGHVRGTGDPFYGYTVTEREAAG